MLTLFLNLHLVLVGAVINEFLEKEFSHKTTDLPTYNTPRKNIWTKLGQGHKNKSKEEDTTTV